VVHRYNIIAVEACGAGVVAAEVCGQRFSPSWLTDAPDTARDNTVLRTMIDDTAAHLEPFWNGICAKAERIAKDEAFCQLE
jgi:hypothetical protein